MTEATEHTHPHYAFWHENCVNEGFSLFKVQSMAIFFHRLSLDPLFILFKTVSPENI